MYIESLQNDKVKEWKKLNRKKDRDKQKCFLIEGEHLLEEAMRSDWNIREIIQLEGNTFSVPKEVKVITVSEKVFRAIASTNSPQGIMAVVQMKTFERNENDNKVLLLDAVQDPGNVGTMVRTADALGFDAVILGKGTVDVYNEKTVRASQGSLFHIPVMSDDLLSWCHWAKRHDFQIWATSLRDAKPLMNVNKPNKMAVILGNEGSGVDNQLLDMADERVYIPITGKAESLNVSIAAGILMHYLQN
ncbi:TrmH family RNA methyltransferase [Salirhabdus salicampi]|uniref:TrmH family RNA methyltransferase n=1 Tax=Salirhabdus salicampi TaxID=476102 RepID=UPI0020C1ED11|nr:RNA methyltransferase [Salirhabdus salicampi]MCP8617066.1 RNA methyltransferase [Salirhabdus salicampi]